MTALGRPTVMTEDIIAKLEEGFLRGYSDREACLYSDIATSTLYEYCKANPEFAERKELLKESLKIRAKDNVAEELAKKNLSLSQWYLERRAKDEFSPKVENEHSGTVALEVISYADSESQDSPQV